MSDTKQPPCDINAERALLGSVLLSKDAAAEVFDRIKPNHFYYEVHKEIYKVMLDLYAASEPTDMVSVSESLRKNHRLEHTKGFEYLNGLAEMVPTPANVYFYVNIVMEKAILRNLAQTGVNIFHMAMDGVHDVEEIVNKAQSDIFSVTTDESDDDLIRLDAVVKETCEGLDESHTNEDVLRGIETGFTRFDSLTNGLHPGQMVIIAARPSMGKSTLALDFARSAAIKQRVPTVFFSLEMGRQDIAMRLLSAETGIPLQNIRHGKLSPGDWGAIGSLQGKLADVPFFIDDSPNVNLVEIRAKCRRLKQQGLGFVIIDYLQLLSGSQRVETRQQEVSEFSRSLKLLAKELQLPVLALSQLNRSSEQRADKRPAMADLRESGSIEQDADLVVLLHRDEYYDKNARAGEGDLIIAKHRNGPTDNIPVAFHGKYSRFADLPRQDMR
ncbi:replicative DNA helicase [Tropheryma whipplei]|uniref:replicative DNA helicase n=1 Tax=Tropheryma whipplei TaxID=2039 RepID=UPI0004AFC84B|nr:replicative DNA helicase [Tropheryma whipplei]